MEPLGPRSSLAEVSISFGEQPNDCRNILLKCAELENPQRHAISSMSNLRRKGFFSMPQARLVRWSPHVTHQRRSRLAKQMVQIPYREIDALRNPRGIQCVVRKLVVDIALDTVERCVTPAAYTGARCKRNVNHVE